MPAALKTASTTSAAAAKSATIAQESTNKKRALDEDQQEVSANAGKRVKTASDVVDLTQDEAENDDESGSEEDDDEEDEDEEDETPLAGKFDLYDMDLAFLNCKYAPAGKKDVDPEALYRTILTYQAKNDRTAKATIPDDYAATTSIAEGEFSATFLYDPFTEEPFDISISGIEVKDNIGFKSKYAEPKDRWDGEGLKGRMEINGGGCGIASSSGSFCIRPLWQAEDKNGELMELFEGTLSFKASFTSLYTRKGHGRGTNPISFPFWAVRAL